MLSDKPMHGYDLIRELEERSGGAWRPSPGSIYPTLQLIEDEGLVETADEMRHRAGEEKKPVAAEAGAEAGDG